MIFDEVYSLPKPNGATDYLDSPVIAAMMILSGHPESYKIDSRKYFQEGKYFRFPFDKTYDMSRDNSVPLITCIYLQGYPQLVDKSYIDGKDFLSPSVRGHIRRCQDREANWFQNLWIKLDIIWNAYIDPLSEPNQLICMLVVAGPKYVKLWTKLNPMWRVAITTYWCGWRGESGLAAHMINRIEGMCEKKS